MIKMLEPYYRILMHDPDGNLVKDTGLIPSGSYVIQFLELMESLFNITNKDAKDVNAASSRIITTSADVNTKGRVDGAVGADTYGIVVGTNAGSTPEDNENYRLDTKILHSAVGEAGKLNYRNVTFIAPHELAGNIDLDISRAFLNETGSAITINEIGIICRNTSGFYHLLLRDVVAPENVPDGNTLTVVYTLRTTV